MSDIYTDNFLLLHVQKIKSYKRINPLEHKKPFEAAGESAISNSS